MGWVAVIPLLPAAAFAVMLPLSRAARAKTLWLPVAAAIGSLALSVAAFGAVAGRAGAGTGAGAGAGAGENVVRIASATIVTVGGAPVRVSLGLDAVSAVMLLVVTVVGACVQVYSLGYMHRDARRGWYFAVLSLFTAAMLTLVLARDFLLLYMAWEVMGLCSYLLIGFWHEEPAPRAASMKAFLTTRVGDVGFAFALAVMWAVFGSFEFAAVIGQASTLAPATATVLALGLLAAAVGKSAQVPLHVWLPDAMAGPTPASALIHAATMVAAGVYLVGRALPIFEHADAALMPVLLGIGMVTALMAAALAVVQYDIKRILAYSTISQLGYMFMALGAGSETAAFWHLTTHAFFKSLLFLGAGVIIHAAHSQDIRDMGGLRRTMPWTTAAFSVGALALAGVFPFSGFWSKDEVLTAIWRQGHYVAYGAALLTALLTAFYVGRMWLRVFGSSYACSLAGEGHREMLAPMYVLAALTVGIGAFSPAFAALLGEQGHWPSVAIAGASSAAALAGLLAAWWVYGLRRVDSGAVRARFSWLYGALTNRLYFDAAYGALAVRGYTALARAAAWFDRVAVDGVVDGAAAAWGSLTGAARWTDERVVDAAVDGVGVGVKAAGAGARRLQAGRVQTYQRLVFGALLVLVVWLTVGRS